MTTPLPLARELQDLRTSEITDALDPAFLSLLSWDWGVRVARYPNSHPVLGMPDCEIPGCVKGTPLGEPICVGCMNRWRRSGLSLEDFTARGRTGRLRSIGQKLCEVPQCERPRRSVAARLCPAHQYHWARSSDLTMEDFLSRPNLHPLPAIGPCHVASCYRSRSREGNLYCDVHASRPGIERKRGTFDGDEDKWRRTTPGVAVDREISLRGLPDRLVAELLYRDSCRRPWRSRRG